jgi:hypothetical protein
LDGFQVRSSRTAFLRAEQMFDLEGAIEIKARSSQSADWELANDCDFNLRDVGLLYRSPSGQLQSCWLGEVPARSRRPVSFAAHATERPWHDQWDDMPEGASGDDQRINLRPLFELAARQLRLRPGDMRLIGWSPQPVPGLRVRPGATQQLLNTMVLAHLRYGPIAPPSPDVNLLGDVPTRSSTRPSDD